MERHLIPADQDGAATKTSEPETSHLPVLDAVRGLAAFWVLIAHSFAPAGITQKIPVLGDGRAAVDIFMILSGFRDLPAYLLSTTCFS